jgi:hypothetical protein
MHVPKMKVGKIGQASFAEQGDAIIFLQGKDLGRHNHFTIICENFHD